MKYGLLASGVIALLCFPTHAFAGQEQNLRGIDRVCVVVEASEDMQQLRASYADIVSDVETQLRKGGLKIGDRSEGLPKVIVGIAAIDPKLFNETLIVELTVADQVVVERTKQRLWAPVWKSYRFPIVPKPATRDELKPTITRMVDLLLNDVAKVN